MGAHSSRLRRNVGAQERRELTAEQLADAIDRDVGRRVGGQAGSGA